MSGIKILIAGDLCPINRNERLFVEGNIKDLLRDAYEFFTSADLTIVNLECPLIQSSSPIFKPGGHILGASKECANAFDRDVFNVINLANNHIMDHGILGLETTMDLLRDRGLKPIGIMRSSDEKFPIFVSSVNGFNIGIVTMSQTEFSSVELWGKGAIPIDLMRLVLAIKEIGNKVDFLIAMIHTGIEGFPFPSPYMHKLAHFLIDIGVNIVTFQHSHVSGAIETYKSGFISYGQGNFLFDWDPPFVRKPWNYGYLLFIKIYDDKKFNVELIPYLQSSEKPGLELLKSSEREKFLSKIYKYSEILGSLDRLKSLWIKRVKASGKRFLSLIYLGTNRYLRYMDEKLNLTEKAVSDRRAALLWDIISCESNHEILSTYLRERFKEK